MIEHKWPYFHFWTVLSIQHKHDTDQYVNTDHSDPNVQFGAKFPKVSNYKSGVKLKKYGSDFKCGITSYIFYKQWINFNNFFLHHFFAFFLHQFFSKKYFSLKFGVKKAKFKKNGVKKAKILV